MYHSQTLNGAGITYQFTFKIHHSCTHNIYVWYIYTYIDTIKSTIPVGKYIPCVDGMGYTVVN